MKVEIGKKSDISVLSVELLVEILCRLGCVKYATQCKSVCKRWCSLLDTDPYFLRRWGQMNPTKESVALITRYKSNTMIVVIDDPTFRVNLNFLPCFNGKDRVHVVGSHKDLLLCSSGRGCYYICNAFTKQWAALPPPPPPTDARAEVEFIVDELAGGGLKFTVVRIIPFYPRDGRLKLSIFSSDGGWREMDDRGWWRDMFAARRWCKIVSYKQSLVWLMRNSYSNVYKLYSWDLRSYHTRLLLLPRNADDRLRGMSTIVVREGRLRMAQVLDDYRKLIVWQLDDSDSWRQNWHMLQEFEMDFGRLLAKDSIDEQGFRIATRSMAFHPHDGDILYMQVDDIMSDQTTRASYIVVCDLKTRRLEMLELPKYMNYQNLWRDAVFPLVKRCWPTPVPRLQSQVKVRFPSTSKFRSFFRLPFASCF